MKNFKVPHTLVLLFGMIVLAYILTLVVPQGEFEKVTNDDGREVVVAGSYHAVSKPKLGIEAILTTIPKGFQGAAEIIFFVFIVGGAIGVLRATGTIDAMIGVMLRNFKSNPGLLVVGMILLFCAGSSTIGMAEEYLPFVPILIALCIGFGFDAVTAIGILCVGYGIGYGLATFNPFTLMIAQGVAGVAPTTGNGYRFVLLVPFLAVGIHHVWSYARKVKADPSKSLVADVTYDTHITADNAPPLTTAHIINTITVLATMVIMVIGIKFWHWYLVELMALFMLLTIIWAAVSRLNPDRTASQFCEGAAELTTTALLIGFARTIEAVLNDGHVVDTIINAIAQPLGSLGPEIAAVGMFFFQSVCNLFIPSGSGQAFVTMPVMAPLADLVGVSRQVAVMAYQFGDGFTNILVPTNAVLVGILAMAKIPYDRWFRFIIPFMIKVWILGSIAMVVAVLINYQ